jgi:anaerobic ribonucleoside-triphosphate reductase activating protein
MKHSDIPIAAVPGVERQDVRIHRRRSPVTVLGPGNRAVIWVQGCSLGCCGCIIPESWAPNTGETISVAALTAWVLQQREIDGVTFSGGEPMEQALALAQIIDDVRKSSDLGVVCYTGYTFEHLRDHGTSEQRDFLTRIDLLIDGLYVESLHAPFLWRGSSNQRLIPLSDRYLHVIPEPGSDTDRCAGLELFMGSDGAFSFAGVPPENGFRRRFQALMLERGVSVATGREGDLT